MPGYLVFFWDTFFAYLIFAAFLFMLLDERPAAIPKKLALLLPAPFLTALLMYGLYGIMREAGVLRYAIGSAANLFFCTVWISFAWRPFQKGWRAFASACMAGILQVANSALGQFVYDFMPSGGENAYPLAMLSSFIVLFIAAWLLARIWFGRWFRLLLEDAAGLRRTALLLFAFLISMEAFLMLERGVQPGWRLVYFALALTLVCLMVALVVDLGRRFEDRRKLEAQRDMIAQQQLYEQDLEMIRQEVRAFRHDYKNLLAGLSQQANAGELDALRAALAGLDAGFDQRIGETIQTSVQLGNLRIPQLRSLLLTKLAGMRAAGVDCRLEVLYPVETAGMDGWDLVRCLGILIDNAAEAAQKTPCPWVELVLLAQGGQLSVRVANPFAALDAVDPALFWQEGWSTKGPGRGLGLASCQRILKEYPNAAVSTSWENGVFVQELTIEAGGQA